MSHERRNTGAEDGGQDGRYPGQLSHDTPSQLTLLRPYSSAKIKYTAGMFTELKKFSELAKDFPAEEDHVEPCERW